MSIEIALRLIDQLVWPAVAILAMFLFRGTITDALAGGRINVKIFGAEIETTGEKVAEVIWNNFNYFSPSLEQWVLLTRLVGAGGVGVDKSDVIASGLDYKQDLRPLRNAGLITGDGPTLSRSERLLITPLGDFIVRNARNRPKSEIFGVQ